MTDPAATPQERGRWQLVAGSINGFLAVGFGAFGAHGLRDFVDAGAQAAFVTAAHYHGWHALALVVTGLLAGRLQSRWIDASSWLFLVGILLFSGSLYALTLGAPKWLGPVTPIGGIALLAGWAALALGSLRAPRQ